MLSFAGRVVVITGGASGIGLATARALVAGGASLALIDRDSAALETAGREFPQALRLAGDVGDESTVVTHTAAILASFGRIDGLVTAAGWSTGKTVSESSLAEWEGVLRTNLTGTFLWCRAALAPMRAVKSGAIVVVGSQLALAGGRANAPYLASKGAVVSLARSMALDHAADGIRVNAVIPGAIDTPLLTRAFARAAEPDAARARSIARHPLGRLGRAEEVARAILFLLGDEASFTTGSCLMVDGGWLAA